MISSKNNHGVNVNDMVLNRAQAYGLPNHFVDANKMVGSNKLMGVGHE